MHALLSSSFQNHRELTWGSEQWSQTETSVPAEVTPQLPGRSLPKWEIPGKLPLIYDKNMCIGMKLQHVVGREIHP